jgi:hypothetical protein
MTESCNPVLSSARHRFAYREVPMPRTKGASGIVGWQRHSMFRDIAAGELNPDEIAEKYGVATQYV